MKRRVLRTHNNKKVLRTIQAAHGVKDPHHVLCDETFLRSVVGQSDVESVRTLVGECMGMHFLHVLPETIRNLERHQHFKAYEFATHQCQLVAGAAAATATPTSDRNELKAIAATVKAEKPQHFFFVATQSHDLRALLPSSVPILRATFKPTAVWLEQNGLPSGSHAATSQQPQTPQKRKTILSGADAAFLESLGINNKTGKKRRNLRSNSKPVPTPVMQTEGGSQQTSEAVNPVAASTMKPKHQSAKKKPKGANPLSMKKKTPRETFSVEEPPRSKRRVG